MKFYLVGGAVRDALLGRPVRERDHVVVGATPDQMHERGFKPVGSDFPVFLHPDTGEEYALARTERKSGVGHKGFVFHADVDVTLEQDLHRRDFTINAIAEDPETGRLHDPCGGRRDCAAHVLRHVSDAFGEDPLRVLRAARFVADLHLTVAPATEETIRATVAAGELVHLSGERVFRELERGLMGARPQVYFSLLRRWGALREVLPEVDALFGVEQPAASHPEGCAGVHTMLVLAVAADNFWGLPVRLAALLHDIGKARTAAEHRPSHPGHEAVGAELAAGVCERLKVPRKIRQQVLAATAEHGLIHSFSDLDAEQILDLFGRIGVLRAPDSAECLLALASCDHASHPGRSSRALHPAGPEFYRLLAAAGSIDAAAAAAAGADDPAAAVRCARLQALQEALSRPPPAPARRSARPDRRPAAA